MKITNLTVSTVPTSKAFGGESKAARVARMKSYWSDKSNAVLLSVGRLLAQSFNGKTLAAHVLAGETLELPAVSVNGQSYPLADGFQISMANIKTWGCPACHSAHGSGVGTSRDRNEGLLASNAFYYNPASKTLVTISDTCFSNYVVALGANKAERFVAVLPMASTLVPATPAPKSK